MERLTTAALGEMLDILNRSDLLQAGGVNLISVEAVQNRIGASWGRKKEFVWEFVERQLKDRLEPGDLWSRVSDTLFMIATPTTQGLAAQGVCMNVLEAVLLYFIGRIDHADVKVYQADRIEDGALYYTDVDVSLIPRPDTPACRVIETVCESPARAAERTPLFFTTMGGRSLRLDFTPQPLCSLRNGVVNVIYIARRVSDASTGATLEVEDLAGLSDVDVSRIDAGTLDYTELYLSGSGRPMLPVAFPLSWRTLTTPRGRQMAAEIVTSVKSFKMMGVVEIVDLSPGTPHGRLLEAAGLANQYARRIVARTSFSITDFSYLANAGFSAFTIDFQHSRKGPRALHSLSAKTWAVRVRALTRNLIGLGVPNPKAAPMLAELGFTHYGVAANADDSASPSPPSLAKA